MRTLMTKRTGIVAALVLTAGMLAGGCTIDAPTQPIPDTGSLDFSTMVVIGNSLTAGFVSGGLGLPSQDKSWPKLLAGAVGYDGFEQPTISAPGLPSQLMVTVVTPSGGSPTPSIAPISVNPGVPQNTALARPYNNLGVPGTTTVGMLTDDGSTGGMGQIVLRGLGTQLEQAATLAPSVVFLWIGNNDVLGAVVAGLILDGTTTVPSAVSASNMGLIFGALATTTSADLVVMNVPDVTSIPYVTFPSRGVMSPLTDATGTQIIFPVITTGTGGIRQAAAGDYILLPALSAMGADPTLGTSGANPLPNSLVLDSAEITDLQARVTALNAAIATQVTNFNAGSAPRTATLIDIFAFFNTVKGGASYMVGTTTYPLAFHESGVDMALNAAFAFDSGMAFSLDGIHPTPVGYTLVTNYISARLNQTHGSSIPQLSYTSALHYPKVAPARKLTWDEIPDFRVVSERLKEIFLVKR